MASIEDNEHVTLPPRRRNTRRVVIAGTFALVVFILLFVVVEGPIANTWYQARQRSLAAQLNQPEKKAKSGQAIGIVQIPIIGLNLVVGEGDGANQLRAGPGHRPNSPLPGAIGNSVIFGHRHGWGGPFSQLGKLAIGDEVFFKTRLGEPTLFVVRSVKTTSASDRRPFATSGDHRLTLVTATGGLESTRRLVVTAVSGTPGKLSAPSPTTSSGTPADSVVLNSDVVVLVVLVVAAMGSRRALGSRYSRGVVAVVVSPLVAAAVLALFLDLDLLLPRLR
jgi:sortase A